MIHVSYALQAVAFTVTVNGDQLKTKTGKCVKAVSAKEGAIVKYVFFSKISVKKRGSIIDKHHIVSF